LPSSSDRPPKRLDLAKAKLNAGEQPWKEAGEN
jgi:hypothetical protein